ncbi:MAG TPA: hypothetical protein ENK80_01785 [Rhodobacterales bacterium]|nr:hypothetical protein [Rhodobacterales bacterium]
MSDANTTPLSLPGEKHNRDMANPGEMGAFLLAFVIVAALATGFLLKGLAGVGLVMVMIVPVIYVALVLISVGR